MFKPTHIFAFSLGAGLTVLLMLFIGYQLDGDMGLCRLEAANSAAETPVTCAREWIGALSGWIAAAGALGVGLPTVAWLRAQTQLPTTEVEIADLEQLIRALKKTDGPIGKLYLLMDSGKLHGSDIVSLSDELCNSLELIKRATAKCRTLGFDGSDIAIDAAMTIASELSMDWDFIMHFHGDTSVSEEDAKRMIAPKIDAIRDCIIRSQKDYIPPLQSELERLSKWRYRIAVPRS
ncbi:hypothetical protein [uncultured Cohaesibacter sp.]|uniref:hypothetical protein n=1 Tax=uncultured Cohaesibacter sp. TaxID=1002546 RepID=UPI0029C7C2C0|nr:hypothetical protein [uncultured Cohaesibacter sp.]